MSTSGIVPVFSVANSWHKIPAGPAEKSAAEKKIRRPTKFDVSVYMHGKSIIYVFDLHRIREIKR
jgi:hypothetical protein